jgi:hypothetical protein
VVGGGGWWEIWLLGTAANVVYILE